METASGRSETLTIGEMAAHYGVSLRALRFYEEKGMLAPARSGVERLYSAQDATRLQVILLGKRFGFSLSEIAKLLETRPPKTPESGTIDDLGLGTEEIERRIDQLTEQRCKLHSAIGELRATLLVKSAPGRDERLDNAM